MNLEGFMKMGGVLFEIVRGDVAMSEKVEGLPNHEKATNKAYIGFRPGADVKVGDVLVNPASETHYVIDVKTQYIRDQAFQLKCFYISQAEHDENRNASATKIQVNNAYGSVIGAHNTNVSVNADMSVKDIKIRIYEEDSPDKAILLEIASILENIQEGKQEPKKGMFAKFASALENNSWITGAIASTLLSWMITM